MFQVRQNYFNPRSPYGERPGDYVPQNVGSQISIHAPLTGSDDESTAQIEADLQFQSTLPLRGATTVAINQRGGPADFNPRSPYGERR